MQKQRIELELAESRARIGSEILEKAQRNQEDSIHIDQANEFAHSCQNVDIMGRAFLEGGLICSNMIKVIGEGQG